jgi:hypothetical protein
VGLSVPDPEKIYHGRPCKHCDGTLRWRSNRSCVECEREWKRAKRAADPEYRERERAGNRERSRARRADPEYREQQREWQREWYHEKVASDLEWAERERERKQDWYYGLSGFEYNFQLLKNRRRQALKRMEIRSERIQRGSL